jgi:hypothetical protein
LKLEWALNIEYATQGQKRKDDFGYILIIEYHMDGETSNRNQLRYISLVATLWVHLLKYHKNIRYKNIIKSLDLVTTLDSRTLSLTVTPNPTIIFIILIIIFHLLAKIFIFFNLSKKLWFFFDNNNSFLKINNNNNNHYFYT